MDICWRDNYGKAYFAKTPVNENDYNKYKFKHYFDDFNIFPTLKII